ncbi:RNA polymerase factor sigma-54 [Candidatus Poribacteria bacterium]|nr:RNA polymerase factor sigma-54 [Candidatus Poribacteria bacterium]
MRTGLILQPRLQQKLVMTPRLQQAIEVMQMTNLELVEHLSQELEVNPFLEEGLDLDEEAAIEQEAEETDSSDLELAQPEEGEPEIRVEDFLDDSMPSRFEEEWQDDDEDGDRRLDIAQEASFHDYVHEQLALLRLTPDDRAVGELILGNLDDEGFLAATIEELAEETGREPAEVEEILIYLQRHLEPMGVGSRSRQEYFLIQLQAAEEPDPIAIAVTRDYYEDLLRNQLPRIAKCLRDDGYGEITVDTVQIVKESLVKLQLAPAHGFLAGMHGSTKYSAGARPITPDVIVERVDGEYRVRAAEESIPRIHLNRRYLELLANGSNLSREERRWLEDYRQRARELIGSIHERGKTIENVARAIFEVQEGFLEHGVTHLKPLVLRDIGERLGKSDSTISRATNGKYVQTPRGIYELKFFFSSALEQDSGELASSKSIRALIKQMVEAEDPGKPLSDQAISKMLGKQGYRIARRTVTKYREDQGIPASNQRRNRWE